MPMWIAGSYIRSVFNLLEEPPYHHPPWWLDHFTFQRECTPAVYSGSLFSTPSPTLVISCLLLCFPFGCAGPLLLCGPFLVAVSRSRSSLQCTRFSLQWLLSLQSTGCRCTGFSSGSIVFSCSMACGIFLDQESNLCALHW